MRNEIFTDKLGRPVRNKVLVSVDDHFNEIKTKSGLILPNVAHNEASANSPGYSFSEFIPRFGTVLALPKTITSGTFDYETKCEIEVGDTVYWNLIAFASCIPLVCDEKKYLLVDYHELILFVDNKQQIVPINGYALFTAVPKETGFGVYVSRKEVTEKWKLHTKPLSQPKELNPRYYHDDIWEIGDVVLLKVADKPFKLEGQFVSNLPEEVYAAPLRMILCEA
jgi:co-chaperonin GroES (HSP10)